MIYHFSAIYGLEQVKKGIILNLIDKNIGGILLIGSSGLAKSTIARSAVSILPSQHFYKDCKFGCSIESYDDTCIDIGQHNLAQESRIPFLNLPISIDEEALIGSIDIKTLLNKNDIVYNKGILCKGNNGIIYVDELHLLHPNIIDRLLDVLAMNRVYIEKDNLSLSYRSKFILIGSMNYDAINIRPQLIDRLGMYIELNESKTVEDRVEILSRQIDYSNKNDDTLKRYHDMDIKLKNRIIESCITIKKIKTDKDIINKIAKISDQLNITSMRFGITLYRISRAIAAFNDQTQILDRDIEEALTYTYFYKNREGKVDDRKSESTPSHTNSNNISKSEESKKK